jgi:ABC-type sugar transport system ATPase subunit
MAHIRLEGLTKVFGGTVHAVKDLSLEIRDGSVVSLLGPSGCGKTTTMRMIAGLETPTRGRILIDGRDVTGASPKNRDMAMVFQLPVNYDTLSVRDNLAFPLMAKKMGSREIDHRIRDTLELFDIPESYLRRKIAGLGLSDRQRVSLAHAFVVPRNLYLLDEPLSNLDPKGREDLRIKIKDVQSRIGQTILYVTHDQSEAMTLADKIAIMQEGRLLQFSRTREMFHDPRTRFVGWFLGNPGMNFIPCVYRRENGRALFDADGFQYAPHGMDIPGETPQKTALHLGIRPEHVRMSREKREGWIPSRCELTEPMGTRLLLFLRIGEDLVTVKTNRNDGVGEGTDAWVSFPEKDVRFFHGETGEAMGWGCPETEC